MQCYFKFSALFIARGVIFTFLVNIILCIEFWCKEISSKSLDHYSRLFHWVKFEYILTVASIERSEYILHSIQLSWWTVVEKNKDMEVMRATWNITIKTFLAGGWKRNPFIDILYFFILKQIQSPYYQWCNAKKKKGDLHIEGIKDLFSLVSMKCKF